MDCSEIECPTYKGEICAGNGECEDNVCKCKTGYYGRDCSV
jgi:hypothetical protein